MIGFGMVKLGLDLSGTALVSDLLKEAKLLKVIDALGIADKTL